MRWPAQLRLRMVRAQLMGVRTALAYSHGRISAAEWSERVDDAREVAGMGRLRPKGGWTSPDQPPQDR